MLAEPLRALRALRDEMGETFLLALARVGIGLLLLNEAWLATQHFRAAGYFGGCFHQPFLPESLVPSEGMYQALLAAQWAAGALVVSGRGARPALLSAAGLLEYTMLCDRLWFHNYRHTMAAFSMLLAFSPCDRHLLLLRPARREPQPIWAMHALKAQISVMYLASAGSKLLDPEWRCGQMMQAMLWDCADLMSKRGWPPEFMHLMQTPLGASLLAKGAIGTELSLAVLLWCPRTRRLALWIGLFFHLWISMMTIVWKFTIEMLLVYLLFALPDSGARVVRFDPRRHQWLANTIHWLDWLRRFRLEPREKAVLSVVDRDGTELTGLRAAACIFGALPAPFVVWPLVAAAARLPLLKRGSPHRAPEQLVVAVVPATTMTVLYDGDCPFCTRSAQAIQRRFRRARVALRNFQEAGAIDEYPSITHEAAMKRIHVVRGDGHIFSGAEAFARIVATTPVLGWLAWLYYVPGIRQLADLGYSLVAKHRYRLFGRAAACDDGTCHLHGA